MKQPHLWSLLALSTSALACALNVTESPDPSAPPWAAAGGMPHGVSPSQPAESTTTPAPTPTPITIICSEFCDRNRRCAEPVGDTCEMDCARLDLGPLRRASDGAVNLITRCLRGDNCAEASPSQKAGALTTCIQTSVDQLSVTQNGHLTCDRLAQRYRSCGESDYNLAACERAVRLFNDAALHDVQTCTTGSCDNLVSCGRAAFTE